jgi:transposase
VTQLPPVVDGTGAIAGKSGRPRQRPDRVTADRGDDHDEYRRELWLRGVKSVIARRATQHGSRRTRAWVVERTFAWLHPFRRLRIPGCLRLVSGGVSDRTFVRERIHACGDV